MDQDIFYLLVIWMAAGGGLYLCENSGLLPTPKRVLQSLITAIGLIVLYILVRRVG